MFLIDTILLTTIDYILIAVKSFDKIITYSKDNRQRVRYEPQMELYPR